MSSPPSDNRDDIVRVVDAASEATYEDAGADDEVSFTIGKILGIQLMRALKASANMVAVGEHIDKRCDEGEKFAELCNGLLRHKKIDESTMFILILQIRRVIGLDTEFFEKQMESYAKDLEESSAELTAMLGEEERTEEEEQSEEEKQSNEEEWSDEEDQSDEEEQSHEEQQSEDGN